MWKRWSSLCTVELSDVCSEEVELDSWWFSFHLWCKACRFRAKRMHAKRESSGALMFIAPPFVPPFAAVEAESCARAVALA